MAKCTFNCCRTPRVARSCYCSRRVRLPTSTSSSCSLLADACRRAGAARITAVIPYFGYARHDRRATGFESVAARLVADLIVASGVQRVITLDPHTQAIEGFFTIPIERLTAVPALADAMRPYRPADGVIVAPDLGAAKLAETYGRLLELPVAIVHKTRTGPEAVSVSRRLRRRARQGADRRR